MCNKKQKKLCSDDSCNICFTRSVASCDKSIINRWSPKNNYTPRQIKKSSKKLITFDCELCHHETIAKIKDIIKSNEKCYFCSSKQVCGDENCSFCKSKTYVIYGEKIFKCWSEKNTFSPYQITKGSEKEIIFNCDKCGHEFTSCPSRIKQNNWCPYCINRKLCNDPDCENCFSRSFASCVICKLWSSKNKINPRNIPINDKRRYYFMCKKCGHDFLMSPSDLQRGYGCNYCSNKVLCNDRDCKICFDKSAASCCEEIIKMWSPQNNVSARQIFKNGDQKYLFFCDVCNHTFSRTIYNMINSNECKYCPFCTNKKICGDKDCKICFPKTFASYNKNKLECWSNKNEKKPWQVFRGTQKMYWFICNICNHEFNISLNNITSNNQWCPYCGSRKLCDKIDCETCYNNSFASNPLSKFLIGNLRPRDIFRSSHKKLKFKCNNCSNIFEKYISDVCLGSWCPTCKKKSENIVYEFISQLHDTERESKFDWCRYEHKLPFDFFIKKYKCIIEVDGIQHFKQISNWVSPLETQKRDIYKMKCALKNNISVVRLFQPDIVKNKIDWKKELLKVIKKYEKPEIIYIESGNMYDIYKKQMN